MAEFIIQKKTKCEECLALPACGDGGPCPNCQDRGYVYEEVPLVEALLDSTFIEDWKLRSSQPIP